MKVQGVLSAIKTTIGGLNTQMRRLELISENIANAEKTPGEDGKLYKRKVLADETNDSKLKTKFSDTLNMKLRKSDNSHFSPGSSRIEAKNNNKLEVIEQDGEILVFEPNHPMADEKGYIRKPDVNMVEEMVDMISATRMYEANVTVMNAAKNLAKKALEI